MDVKPWMIVVGLAGATLAAAGDAPERGGLPAAACGVCGGACGLEPVCVCEPTTTKVKKVSYTMRCEPVCVPTGHGPSPVGHGGPAGSCTATGCGCDGACGTATVRTRKLLVKTVTEEEVDAVERKVEYRCRHCAGIEAAPTCSSCAGHGPAAAGRPWWKSLWPW